MTLDEFYHLTRDVVNKLMFESDCANWEDICFSIEDIQKNKEYLKLETADLYYVYKLLCVVNQIDRRRFLDACYVLNINVDFENRESMINLIEDFHKIDKLYKNDASLKDKLQAYDDSIDNMYEEYFQNRSNKNP